MKSYGAAVLGMSILCLTAFAYNPLKGGLGRILVHPNTNQNPSYIVYAQASSDSEGAKPVSALKVKFENGKPVSIEVGTATPETRHHEVGRAPYFGPEDITEMVFKATGDNQPLPIQGLPTADQLKRLESDWKSAYNVAHNPHIMHSPIFRSSPSGRVIPKALGAPTGKPTSAKTKGFLDQ